MKFSASIVWLVMAAVINPLCCCMGALHGMDEPVGTQTSMSCCAAENTSRSGDTVERHSTQDCPHQLEKKAHPIQASVDHAPTFIPILGLWLGLPQFTVFSTQPLISSFWSTTYVTTNNSPPGNHQLLCLYLI